MFSRIKELKKPLLEIWKNLENKILESNKYNALKEKYQSLNLLYQKLIKYSVIGCLLALLLYIPLFYFVSGTSGWLEFKTKQELSWELLKVRRQKAKLSSGFTSDSQIKRSIEQVVKKYFSEDFNLQQQKSKKADFIDKKQFLLKIPYLNIKQAIQLGTELHDLKFVRLDSIQFSESPQYPKHYEMEYELSTFVLVQTQRPVIKDRQKRKKRGRRNKTRKLNPNTNPDKNSKTNPNTNPNKRENLRR